MGVVVVLLYWTSPKAGLFERSTSSAFESSNLHRAPFAAVPNAKASSVSIPAPASAMKADINVPSATHVAPNLSSQDPETLQRVSLPPIKSGSTEEANQWHAHTPLTTSMAGLNSTDPSSSFASTEVSTTEKPIEQNVDSVAQSASLIPASASDLFRPLPAFTDKTDDSQTEVITTAWQSELPALDNTEESVFEAIRDPFPITDATTVPDASPPTAATDSLFDEQRIAMAPQSTDKPKFRKFGSRDNSDTEKDDDDDNEDESDSLTPKQPTVLSAADRWKLAGQPGKGDRYKDDTPLLDSCSIFIEGAHGNFSPTPTMQEVPYDPTGQMNVYQGKKLYSNQRPLLELGRPWYQLGPISEGSSILGAHNHVNWQYLLFGDFRTGIASNRQNRDTNSLVATQLNLVHHLKITSTERIVAGMSPFGAAQNTRYEFDNDRAVFEGDADFDFGFIEADLGAIAGGIMGETLPFDLPIAVGIMPLVFQNGVWFEDAILGAAVTIPAKSSARFDISNMDITFFAGYDKLDSPAFQGDDSAARIVGMAAFIEALNGYFEVDYAFLDDRSGLDRSYHNIAFAYTRRYGRFLSNSTRIIVNAGQESVAQDNTADGVLLISENSLITGSPSTVVPYMNMWAGFDRPQSAARAGIAGGVLRNTGILFESDNLTGYPTLDASANDTFGMALGLNLLADEFAQQFIVEAAMLGVMGDRNQRIAQGDQYGVGARYQLPLSNSVIFRADAMYGFLRGDNDVNGVRMEMRKKF